MMASHCGFEQCWNPEIHWNQANICQSFLKIDFLKVHLDFLLTFLVFAMTFLVVLRPACLVCFLVCEVCYGFDLHFSLICLYRERLLLFFTPQWGHWWNSKQKNWINKGSGKHRLVVWEGQILDLINKRRRALRQGSCPLQRRLLKQRIERREGLLSGSGPLCQPCPWVVDLGNAVPDRLHRLIALVCIVGRSQVKNYML